MLKLKGVVRSHVQAGRRAESDHVQVEGWLRGESHVQVERGRGGGGSHVQAGRRAKSHVQVEEG